jgi:hypothetical protein
MRQKDRGTPFRVTPDGHDLRHDPAVTCEFGDSLKDILAHGLMAEQHPH